MHVCLSRQCEGGPGILERGKVLLRMDRLAEVDNLQNYSAEIIEELKQLLLSGGSALPDPERKGFYDLKNLERTFFIHISSITGRVLLLATWLRPAIEFASSSESGSPLSPVLAS
jgi:hypothetical protein